MLDPKEFRNIIHQYLFYWSYLTGISGKSKKILSRNFWRR